MKNVKFEKIKLLSNKEIFTEVLLTEKNLFQLQFKKATRQSFKSSDIKDAKKYIAKLKTLLTLRLIELEKKRTNNLIKLIKN